MITVTPATLFDLIALNPYWHSYMLRCAIVQMFGSKTITVRQGADVLAVAGLWTEPDFDEAWVLTANQLRGRGSLGAAVLLALKRAFDAGRTPGRPVRVMVKTGHETGLRFAACFGFRDAGEGFGGRVRLLTIDALAPALGCPQSS